MLSYWEKQSFLRYDYIIIGAGLVGMSVALSIRDRKPHATILLLERGILPTGASTKNAGFACIGSLTEILDDLRTMNEQDVVRLVEMRFKGLKKLQSRLGSQEIAYAEKGSYELITDAELMAQDHLYQINTMLRPVLNMNPFSRVDKQIDKFGFNRKIIRHILRNNAEGELDTGKLMRAMQSLCMEKQIEIKTGAEVVSIIEEGLEVKVFAEHKQIGVPIGFSCSKVALCTNAFAKSLFPELDIQPGRGQVLITHPIVNLKLKGIFHLERGYYYFREINGRVLIGGGRNKDFNAERTEKLDFNEMILADLIEKLNTLILPETYFEIDYAWTGIMAFGNDKIPIIRAHTPNVFLGLRLGGMGVALASVVGDELAELMED